jgi:hypothetical protein
LLVCQAYLIIVWGKEAHFAITARVEGAKQANG